MDEIQQIEFPEPIFRVEPAGAGKLAVEIRYADKQQLDIFVLDLAQGGVLGEVSGLDWWRVMLRADEEVVLLHGFEEPGLPVQRGVECYDWRQGELRWKASELLYEGAVAEGIWMDGVAKDRWVLLDAKTGTIRDESDNYFEVRKAIEAYAEVRKRDLHLPGADWPAIFAESEAARSYPSVTSAVQTLTLDDITYVAWHTGQPTQGYRLLLAQFEAGKNPYLQQLDGNLDKLIAEPFFVFGKYLIWQEGRRILCWRER